MRQTLADLRGRLSLPTIARWSLFAIALTLGGCGGQDTSEREASQGTAGCGVSSEDVPAVPEPANSPPPATEPVGEVLSVGSMPEGLAADPETGLVAVGLRNPDGLALVDGESGEVIRRVPIPESPRHLQLAAPGGPVLVPVERSDELVQVDLPDGEVSGETPVGDFPHDATAADGRIFVANESGKSLSVVEDDRVIETLETPVQPGGVAAAEGTGTVGAVAVRERVFEAYDAEDLRSLGRIDAGVGPTHVVAGEDGRFYVIDTQGDAILVFGARPEPARLDCVSLPGTPYGVAIDPRRDHLWVTLTAENRVVRFDLGDGAPRRIADYPTVRQPNTVAVDPASGRVFVAGRATGELQILRPD